jgi:hypothetical protein
MGIYDSEQGPDYGDEGRRMDRDLIPWLRSEWGVDVFLTEFPYFQYVPEDIPPEDDEKVSEYLTNEWVDGLDDIPGSILQRGPYRTDVVAVRVDRRALRTRISRLGHAEPLNGSGQTKRRRRRTYLTFRGDGPMTREYWEQDHGGQDELRSYGEDSARRAFGWLKKRRFLAPVGGNAWDAVDIPLHVHGGVHAIELKIPEGEWPKAVEQAARASVYADYRWIAVPGLATTPIPSEVSERCQETGVGVLTVSPTDGVEVRQWAEQCTPVVDRDLLDRYNVERWDVNERALKGLKDVQDSDRSGWERNWAVLMAETGVCGDILAEVDADSVEIEPEPPTVHGYSVNADSEPQYEPEDADHKPLTAFGGDE